MRNLWKRFVAWLSDQPITVEQALDKLEEALVKQALKKKV
jgi:hypothetical protein